MITVPTWLFSALFLFALSYLAGAFLAKTQNPTEDDDDGD